MSAIELYNKYGLVDDDNLLKQYAYLVKRIAHHLYNRLPSNIQLDDLIQTGMMGLHEAIKTYDPTKGAKFTTYANLKIRGFILDDLRSNEWLPRSVLENSRSISAAIRVVENRSNKEATATEIAEAMGVSVDTYYDMLKDLNATKILDISDPITENEVPDPGETPQVKLLHQQLVKSLAKLIDYLPEREKILLSLYYFEEMNFKEIGKVLNVTESRISQIHAQALSRLKSRLDQL